MSPATPLPAAAAHPGLSLEIQVLRGLAVCMTFIAHFPGVYPQFAAIQDGHFWTGVDLFLTISGYVIAKSFFPQMAGAKDRADQLLLALAFWMRRAYRLLPASLFWAFLLLCAAWGFNRSAAFGVPAGVLHEFMAVLLYAKNIAAAYGPSYSLGLYWSLSLEEQFYFVLPLAMIYLPGLLKPVVFLPLIILFTLFPDALGKHHHLFRFESFLFGIWIYHLRQSRYARMFEPTFLASAAARWAFCAFLLFVIVVGINGLNGFPGGRFYIMVATGALVLAASYNQGYIPSAGLGGRAMVWLGDRSYSVYVCHMPALLLVYEAVFRVFGIYGNQAFWEHAALAVALSWVVTLLLSHFSYRVLEQPWQRRGRAKAQQYLEAQRLA
ncbi:MAG: acyltransferase [Burkholderiaceae bacterium]|nr:acyltransferase [Burkholderiaceae bacterium]